MFTVPNWKSISFLNFQIRKSFFAELGFYENDTLVRIMYEDFIKGTLDADERDKTSPEQDPKRAAFYDVSTTIKESYFGLLK